MSQASAGHNKWTVAQAAERRRRGLPSSDSPEWRATVYSGL